MGGWVHRGKSKQQFSTSFLIIASSLASILQNQIRVLKLFSAKLFLHPSTVSPKTGSINSRSQLIQQLSRCQNGALGSPWLLTLNNSIKIPQNPREQKSASFLILVRNTCSSTAFHFSHTGYGRQDFHCKSPIMSGRHWRHLIPSADWQEQDLERKEARLG